MTYDVGDTATVKLTVAPADSDTAVFATGTDPVGEASSLSVSAEPLADGSQVFTAPLELTAAGLWRVKWTVTGTGAGVQTDTLQVAPLPAPGRTYATTTDLANWLQAAPPINADKLLTRATQVLDELLVGAVYDVTGAEELPSDATVAAVFRDATCAQVDWWATNGIDPTDEGNGWSSVSIGSVSLSGGTKPDGTSARPRYAPAAVSILRVAGVLPIAPIVCG